jgi:hypothetical protein
MRRTLIATGLGGIFGFQSWRLAELIVVSIPWYGQAWILLSQIFLGFAVVASAGCRRWWKRALLFGLAFSIPSSCGALALGPRWVPYSIAAMTEGLVVALLIAFLADAILPRRLESSDHHWFGLARPPERGNTTVEERCAVARHRLAEEKAVLDQLDREREYRGDANFQQGTEDRIIWGELLELELQDFDEQLNRIRQTAGDPPRPRSPSG